LAAARLAAEVVAEIFLFCFFFCVRTGHDGDDVVVTHRGAAARVGLVGRSAGLLGRREEVGVSVESESDPISDPASVAARARPAQAAGLVGAWSCAAPWSSSEESLSN
jgi:hypothetical protein